MTDTAKATTDTAPLHPSPEHAERLAALSAQVRARPDGKRLTIRKPTHGHTVRDMSYKAHCHPADVAALTHILEIDVERKVAIVEGQVTMHQLSQATLEKGLVPATVPEIPTFTVAGLINGEGIQSSSHRHGLFSATLHRVEVVLGDGSIAVVDAQSDPELWELLPASHGTLGIVTGAEIKLVPAGQYVRSTYQCFRDRTEYVKAFEAALDNSAYMEGVVYAPDCHVLIRGDFTDDPGDLPVYDPNGEGNPYYFQHARAMATAGSEPGEDILRTIDYLFRAERGLWWMTECHVGLPFVTSSNWGRKSVDRTIKEALDQYGFNPPGLTTEERERCLVHQDLGMRLSRLHEALDYVDRELQLTPIWNCAIKINDAARETFGEPYVVDVGLYGEPMVRGYRNREKMRAIQKFVDVPSFWGVCYLTKDEVREANTYDFETYERVRARTHAEGAFLHLQDKVVWLDPKDPDPGKIPLWRLHRSYGKYWYVKFLVGAGLISGAVALLLSL